LDYCKTARNREDILSKIDIIKHSKNFKKHIQPLINLGWIEMTNKENPKHRNQN
jgi:ATP-dependent DNA helicase RecG